MKYQYIIFSLFCLSLFLGCDEEEITPRGLGLPSRFEFPEGDNAWDEELVSIYDTYHTMLIYKNLDSSDFVRSWVETGGIGTSGYSGQALDDELAAFYTDFVKNQVFAFLKPELVEGVLPNYIYLTYDLRQKGTPTSGDYSLANYWNGMDFWAWCLKMDPEGLSQWTTCFDLPATPWEHKLRRGVILQNIISEMVEKGRITIPIEFEEDFDYSTPIKYSNADLLDKNPDHYIIRGFPGFFTETSYKSFLNYMQISAVTPAGNFTSYMHLAMRYSRDSVLILYPEDIAPKIIQYYDFTVDYVKENYDWDLTEMEKMPIINEQQN